MRIRKDLLETSDIDWFCDSAGVLIHAASAGGIRLPRVINNRAQLIKSQELAFYMSDRFEDVIVNTELIKRKLQNDDIMFKKTKQKSVDEDLPIFPNYSLTERIEQYASTFVFWAKKGFLSFDRSDLYDKESTLYDLIAFPSTENFVFQHPSFPLSKLRILDFGNSSEWLSENLEKFEEIDLNSIIDGF